MLQVSQPGQLSLSSILGRYMSSKLELDVCYRVYGWHHLVKATELTSGLAESNGSLTPGRWLKSHVPVHRYQLRAQRSETSMGKLYLLVSK